MAAEVADPFLRHPVTFSRGADTVAPHAFL